MSSLPPLLIITGPTATGKTALALDICSILPADIISADSRQVYIGANIATGKDIPSDFRITSDGYANHQTHLYGYDLLPINQPCSVSIWHKFAVDKIAHIHAQCRLPIVVGGTGLYIKSLLQPISTLNVPPNPRLRHQLSQSPVSHLVELLQSFDPAKFDSLNSSDRHNPRRLIRAIEVAQSAPIISKPPSLPYVPFIIGLTSSISSAAIRIAKRVQHRLSTGSHKEYSSLLAEGYAEFLPSLAPGYKYPNDIQAWTTAELQIFRRQLTWFKKLPNCHWFDIDSPDALSQAKSEMLQWYSTINTWIAK